jgi:uncharacterized integral membrane protein (TIGR00698 family)
MKKIIGLVLAIAVGIAAIYIAKLHITLDSLVIGLLLGIILRSLISLAGISIPGIDTAYKFFVPLGLVLYGVNLKFGSLLNISPIAWFQLVVGIILIFWLASLLAERMKISREAAMLTAAGTAICGASAIAISSLIIRPKKEDISRSLIAITLWGILGAFLYPLIQKSLGMAAEAYALFAATTLSQTGFVKMAALAMGKNVETLALSIKVLRTILIVPVVGALWFFFRKNGDQSDSSAETVSLEEKSRPIFLYISLAGFVLAGIVFSFVPVLKAYISPISGYAATAWTFAMASIGLSVDTKAIFSGLISNLLLALFLWLVAMAVFFFGYFVVLF